MVCGGGEAFDGGGGGKLAIPGISGMIDSSAKQFYSATGFTSEELATQTGRSGKNTVL